MDIVLNSIILLVETLAGINLHRVKITLDILNNSTLKPNSKGR